MTFSDIEMLLIAESDSAHDAAFSLQRPFLYCTALYIVYFAIKCSTKRQNDKDRLSKKTTIYTLTEICLSNV